MPLITLLLVGAALLAPAALRAHELLPALLDLKETTPGRVAVRWQLPLSQGQPLPLMPVFPADCRQLGEPQQILGPRSLVVRSTLQCGRGLQGQSIAIDGLPATATEVLLRWKPPAEAWRTLVIRPAEPRVTLAVTSADATTPALPVYLGLGIEHILRGPDHLLFVLGLLLIVHGRR